MLGLELRRRPAIRWPARATQPRRISVYARGATITRSIKARLKQLAALARRHRAGGRGQGLRRYRAGDGEAARRRRPASAGRASTPISSRANSAPGCSSARSSPTLELPPDAPETRSLRRLPRLSRCLPDRGLSGALPARCAALHLLSHHRAQGPYRRANFAPRIGNRIYGCDDCLAVCPWNKFAQVGARGRSSRPREISRAPQLADLAAARRCRRFGRFCRQPVKRIGAPRFLRNVLIAAGNSGDATLARARGREVRATPRRSCGPWRSGRWRGSDPARLAALAPEGFARGEDDADVLREWAAAGARPERAPGRQIENAQERRRARDCAVEKERRPVCHEAFCVWPWLLRAGFHRALWRSLRVDRRHDAQRRKAAALASERIETFVFGPEREDPALAEKMPSPPMCC